MFSVFNIRLTHPTIMKLSARNVLPGKIVSVKKDPISSLVVIEIAPGVKLTSTITADAANELKLAKGKRAYAIIKAPSILIGID
jgi:molybdopterin-binding protein